MGKRRKRKKRGKSSVDWSTIPVVEEWDRCFTVTKGEVPDFNSVPWYYYAGMGVVALIIGVGFSLGGIHLFGV